MAGTDLLLLLLQEYDYNMLLNTTESDTKHSGTWIRNHVSKLSSAQQNLLMRSLTAMTSIDNNKLHICY